MKGTGFIRLSLISLVGLISILAGYTSLAGGDYEPPSLYPPSMTASVETMFLRSGSDGFPEGGNALRGIGEYYDGSSYIDTLTTFGALGQLKPYLLPRMEESGDWGQGKLLWRPDINDIPDSALVVRARLLIRPDAVNQVTSAEIFGYRLMLDWDINEVNWMNRFADSTWTLSGAMDSLGVYTCADCPEVDDYNILGQLNRSGAESTSHTTMKTSLADSTIYLDIQADNIYSAYELETPMDYVNEPVSYTTLGRANAEMGSGASPQGWILLDVTHAIRMWHYGVWENYGLMFKIEDDSMTEKMTLISDTDAESAHRPLLVIEYLYVTEEAPGGDERRRRRITPWRY